MDTRAKLEEFLAAVDPIIHACLATLEMADMRFCRTRSDAWGSYRGPVAVSRRGQPGRYRASTILGASFQVGRFRKRIA